MPIYQFRAKEPEKSCEVCSSVVEIIVSHSQSENQMCPSCGNSLVKIVSPFSVGKAGPSKNLLKDSNLEKHGFTRLTKSGDGTYKVSGADPGGLGKIKVPKD